MKKLMVINAVLLLILIILAVYASMRWYQRDKNMEPASSQITEENYEVDCTSDTTEATHSEQYIETIDSNTENGMTETSNVLEEKNQPTTSETVSQETETIPSDTPRKENEYQTESDDGEWGMGDGFQ